MPCMSGFSSSLHGLFGADGKDESSGVLTIRNLTSQELNISQTQAILTRFARSSAHPTPSATATSNERRVLEPFSTNATTTSPQGQNGSSEQHGNVTEVDLLDHQGNKSEVLYARHNHSHHPRSTVPQQITAIYDGTAKFLTLYESPDYSCWMRDFNDNSSIAALSIPGTHNSPTYHWALPSVRCQAVSPLEQLQNGVRFFDIRVQPARPDDLTSDTLYLVHGAFPISLTGHKEFCDLVNDAEHFLATHPSETLIMSLKREGTGKATDQRLGDILAKHYANDAQKWYTEPTIPTLGQARGKIVLMRRFGLSDNLKNEHGGRGWGLNAESWQDNTTGSVSGQVCVQDFYEVLNTSLIPKKIEASCAQFERAATVVCPLPSTATEPSATQIQTQPQLVYLNFLTASNFFNPRCWPENIAAKLNPAVTRFLCEQHDSGTDTGAADKPPSGGDGGLGIVVCDWVGRHGDWDLVKCIVGMNARRLARERGHGWFEGSKLIKSEERTLETTAIDR